MPPDRRGRHVVGRPAKEKRVAIVRNGVLVDRAKGGSHEPWDRVERRADDAADDPAHLDVAR
eukprot:6495675-Heterocapsa_arctica.AAC.1